MPHGVHKNPTLCWHPPAELSEQARKLAEKRGGKGALSDMLTAALAEYLDRHDPEGEQDR
jgi:hypothetical protein